MSKMNGAQILVESLIREGVEVMFGFQGGAVLPVFDALYDARIKFIMVRHEQGAAHAADGYARSTGKVGVCLATSGPGATNLVTGIATAYMDSIPIVAITGQVPTAMIGNDAFQEADIVGITRPIVKHNYLIKDVNDLARVVKEAFHIASTGRPGPVVIDLPKDISTGVTEFKPLKTVNIRGYNPTYTGHPGQIKKAAELIQAAKQPIIYAGGGVISSGAAQELLELVERTSMPVTTTLMGLGGFPGTHPLFLGMLGMHGTKYANYAVSESDLILTVGARFDDRVTGKLDEFASRATIIHIDIDPSSISKNIRAHLPIVGDVGLVLKELNKLITPGEINPWLKKIADWKKEHPLTYKRGDGKLRPQFVVEQINEITAGQAIITTEVGQNQMWTAQYYKFLQPRTLLSSGGLGTMGYGLPAAIGAQAGNPDKVVFDIAGDGSIQMNIQELMTAVQYKLPVNIAILNNRYLGMVRQWQELFYNKRYAHTSLAVNPDFIKLAEAYGALGILVTEEKQVKPALEKAIASPKPVVIDFRVEEEENVYPMVPAGAALTHMIDGMT